MNEKGRFSVIIVLFIVAFILGCISGGSFIVCNTKDQPDYTRIEQYQQRERELLARIGEYEQREKTRIARENRRIEAERERVRRTETLLGTLWGFGGREYELREELTKEVNILADFFFSVRREYFDVFDNNGDKVSR